jgi:hypothetical protein
MGVPIVPEESTGPLKCKRARRASRPTPYFTNQEELQALRHLVQSTCKAKMDEVMGGKNTGTFDGFESIFEPSMCGQLVQTSFSVCKWGPGDIHVHARVKLYSRSG